MLVLAIPLAKAAVDIDFFNINDGRTYRGRDENSAKLVPEEAKPLTSAQLKAGYWSREAYDSGRNGRDNGMWDPKRKLSHYDDGSYAKHDKKYNSAPKRKGQDKKSVKAP